MTDIVMPRLTDSMEEGTVIAWLKEDGDEIAIGDELVEIETDKASMVYEADAAGTLKIIVGPETTLPIGTPIATVGEAGGSDTGGGAGAGEDSPGRPRSARPGVPGEPSPAPAATAVELTGDGRGAVGGSGGTPGENDSASAESFDSRPPESSTGPPLSTTGERVKASPLARRIALDRGVDLGSLRGSGPGGRIIRVDVERAPVAGRTRETAAVEGGRGEIETVALTRTQQTIARRMSESKATVPHFVLRTEVDMRRAVAVREAFKAEPGAEDLAVPSYNDFVLKAAARALELHPRANGAYEDGTFRLYSRINIGIAVATEGALIVPVISDADRRDLHGIAAESRRLAERVRSGEITPPELSGGTFTVSNLGMFGVSGFDAVINPGQAGILAVGGIADRPVVENDELVPGKLMELSLSCDHRILYGADGALFLATIKAGLEEPGLLA
ncbi:MAG: 2-oxo acid dehydrogenase subunit E2 [Solirubrobacterales bacterium]|nr:2-oxo acid dehydrogenase subunit E2 [Solirubrobacterales bacterium]